MRILTLKQLTAAEACEEQVELFTQHFSKSVEVTEGLAESLACLFDFDWAGRHLLTGPSGDEYYRVLASADAECRKMSKFADAEYSKVCVDARTEYDKVCEPSWAVHEQPSGPVWDKYSKECRTACAEYDDTLAAAAADRWKVRGEAWGGYSKVSAVTFARLYIRDGHE